MAMREVPVDEGRGGKGRSWWLWVLVGVAALGLCCGVLVVGLGAATLLGRREPEFDAALWQRSPDCVPDNPRLAMYRPLREKLLAERPTRQEVLALLGPPNAGDEPQELGYMLGYNIIDCDMVNIFFGPDGRVNEVGYEQG